MSLETELYARLAAHAGVSALVNTRIWPETMQQNTTLPALCYQRISSVRSSSFGIDTGDLRARVQIDCWSDQKPGESGSADAVAMQVRVALQRWSGGNIHAVFVDNEQHLYDDTAQLYRVILDFIIWFKE